MVNVMDPQKSILVLNLVCRNDQLKLNYMQRIAKYFKVMCYYDVPDEVNRLVFCFSQTSIDTGNVSANLSELVHQSIDSVLKPKDTSSSSSSSRKGGGEKSGKGKTTTREATSKSNPSGTFQGGLDDAQEISDSFKIYNKNNCS
jgi:hypothetical protein